MKSMRTKQGFINDITKYLDDNMEINSPYFNNYIYDGKIDEYWLIRYPGATRGRIEVENNIIKNIELYEDSFCYNECVNEGVKQFYGMALDIEEEVD